MSIYDIEVKNIKGETISLSQYKDKVLLIVNTASRCGFTPQYEGLEKIYREFKDKGLEILAFPCNQFGAQEPDGEERIAEFCELNYKTSFPLFSKINVNGKEAHPLYVHLKSEQKGILGTEMIKWNFTKFLVNKKGEVIKRFAPKDRPEDLISEIQALL